VSGVMTGAARIPVIASICLTRARTRIPSTVCAKVRHSGG
jgi:hypothetical protein